MKIEVLASTRVVDDDLILKVDMRVIIPSGDRLRNVRIQAPDSCDSSGAASVLRWEIRGLLKMLFVIQSSLLRFEKRISVRVHSIFAHGRITFLLNVKFGFQPKTKLTHQVKNHFWHLKNRIGVYIRTTHQAPNVQ